MTTKILDQVLADLSRTEALKAEKSPSRIAHFERQEFFQGAGCYKHTGKPKGSLPKTLGLDPSKKEPIHWV
jgi:hypothetical protein